MVRTLAENLAERTFRQVMTDTELTGRFDRDTLKAASKQLANHFWCSAFLAFADAIQQYQDALERVPAAAKMAIDGWLDEWVRPQRLDHAVVVATEVVAHRMVDRIWSILKLVVYGHYPL
ncbi:MAG: hypothetical protein ACREMY_22560, partial [bacterium]